MHQRSHSHAPGAIQEIEASGSGVGAVLAQCFRERSKLHPVAFFSNKFSPAEQNYDIEKCEQERLVWKSGTAYPFMTFTDQKKLEYLSTAKCLNLIT